MKHHQSLIFIFVIFFSLSCHKKNTYKDENLIKYVNPYIGTSFSTTPSILKHGESASEDKGQTVPAVGFPYALTNWVPQTRATEQKCIAPYYHHDSLFSGIRASHWMSGSCTQDYGSVTIMPVTGNPGVPADERQSLFSHEDEVVSPAYYSVYLDEYDVLTQVTGKIYSGIIKVQSESHEEITFIIEPNSDEGEGFIQVIPEKNEIIGYNPAHRIYQGWGGYAGFSGYFVIKFNNEFTKYGVWEKDTRFDGENLAVGDGFGVGAYVTVSPGKANDAKVKIGTSFTSLEAARNNLAGEIDHWDFEQVKLEATRAWNNALNQVQVEGGTEDQKIIYYTALYHAKLLPRIFSDADGSYVGFADDSTVHKAQGYDYYVDFTTWDSYRAVQPLMTILEPSRSLDIVKSLINKAEQGDWLPIFPCWNNYTSGMIGDHLISVIGDAYIKGIRNFDIEKAYHYMRKNAFESPESYEEYADGKGRRALDSYLKYGFIPLEDTINEAFHKNEQVSRTLEYAYDDFVLAEIARLLKKEDDYKDLVGRAKNYQNVFDTSTGFVRGRYADGTWIEDFDPYEKAFFITEGTPFQYTWYVPHDVDGLIDLMGGKEKYIDKLDLFFEQDEYWHGNEPSHHIAYIYAFADQGWKTQEKVREILIEEYENSPGGLSGNDDVGQMSAWAVFSMMGMYPVCPGKPEYILGSPVFDKMTLNLESGNKFIISAIDNSRDNKYITYATLNDKPLDRPYILHSEIMQGGQLKLIMGPEPGKDLFR